jgi:hypothetical protein
MTLATGTNRQQHAGNGSTKAFAFSYQYRAGADLRVILTVAGVETVQATPANYSVSPDGGDSGTVTFVTAPPSGALVTIICDEPVNQPLAVSTIQSFKSQGFQSGLDHLARIGRRAIDMAARSLRLRESDTPGAGAYDVGGNRLTNLAASSDPSDAARKSEITALAGTLAPVATSGAYADLTGKPPLGTAAAQNIEAFATAAQGSKADTAVQPAGLTKTAVGLGNADNTSDANKPVSSATAAALALKANTSALGTAAALNTGTTTGTVPVLGASGLPAVGGSLLTGMAKAQVGLGSVDNTADSAKPVSVLQQAAIDLKASTSALGTAAYLSTGTATGNIPVLGVSGLPAVGGSLLTGLNKAQVGLANVDNTSDANKPISTSIQLALDAKAPLNNPILVAPTISAHPAVSDNTFKIPSTKWVNDAIAGAVASGVADGDKGDIVVSGTGSVWSLDSATAAAIKDRANHTGTQSNATITGLGTASTTDTGTATGNVPVLGASGLPAVGGSLLTGLTKSQVGLSSVDNTSDLGKPISTLTQTALNLKANTSALALVATSGAYADLSGKPTLGTAAPLNTGTASGNIPLLGVSGLPAVGGSLLTGLTKSQVGLGSVDNTADSAKPVSTAQAAAIALMVPLTYLDTDTTLSANSDSKLASQKAVKAYVDTEIAGVASVYTGTTAAEVDFPIGHTIAYATSATGQANNSSVVPRIGGSSGVTTGYLVSGATTALNGTWRHRGYTGQQGSAGWWGAVAQRVA